MHISAILHAWGKTERNKKSQTTRPQRNPNLLRPWKSDTGVFFFLPEKLFFSCSFTTNKSLDRKGRVSNSWELHPEKNRLSYKLSHLERLHHSLWNEKDLLNLINLSLKKEKHLPSPLINNIISDMVLTSWSSGSHRRNSLTKQDLVKYSCDKL